MYNVRQLAALMTSLGLPVGGDVDLGGIIAAGIAGEGGDACDEGEEQSGSFVSPPSDGAADVAGASVAEGDAAGASVVGADADAAAPHAPPAAPVAVADKGVQCLRWGQKSKIGDNKNLRRKLKYWKDIAERRGRELAEMAESQGGENAARESKQVFFI